MTKFFLCSRVGVVYHGSASIRSIGVPYKRGLPVSENDTYRSTSLHVTRKVGNVKGQNNVCVTG